MKPEILTSVNAIACMIISICCICQIVKRVCLVNLWIRAKYVILAVGGFASGLQLVLFGTSPSYGSVMLTLAIMTAVVIDTFRYLKGKQDGTCLLY